MRFMILLPGLINILLLAFLWKDVDRPVLGAVWCLVGIGLHVISDLGSLGWFVGLVMNLGAIVYLLIRFRPEFKLRLIAPAPSVPHA